MNVNDFDAFSRTLARHPTRRATVRLLAGTVFAGLLWRRERLLASGAQRLDRDGDGLYDDDEFTIYGTNPDRFDTDGDGVGDGQEVFDGTDPLTATADAGPAPLACAQTGQSCAVAECCLGYCNQDAVCECVSDGSACAGIGTGGCCSGQPCSPSGFCGASCAGLGARCNSDAECCQGNYAALCCFDGVSLTTRCTDVTNIGFVCPGDAPAPEACPAGQTDCGGSCVDLTSHAGHCGRCFNACPLGGTCQGGACGGIICLDGETDCGGYCADLLNDEYNCGACHNLCDSGVCTSGSCGAICFGPGTLCTADSDCCSGDCFGVCI
ncbi:MAG: hypothetical protein U0Z70_00725 [Thermomicrobiales bacterium]